MEKLNTKIKFQAYLSEKFVNPISTDLLSVTAETYKINYEISLDGPIDLKSINVGSLASESFILKNIGLHDFEYS